MEFSGFDWDDGNRSKCQKHGVSVETVEHIFHRGLMILPDEAHSLTEQRFRAIGYSGEGRALFIVFTIRRRRGEVLIRPISARFMHRKEVEHYEKTYRS
jgi:uncharacterized DUF497 family protein